PTRLRVESENMPDLVECYCIKIQRVRSDSISRVEVISEVRVEPGCRRVSKIPLFADGVGGRANESQCAPVSRRRNHECRGAEVGRNRLDGQHIIEGSLLRR